MPLTHRSQLALYLTVFLSCTSFSIVMPTLWPYLHHLGAIPFNLAATVATYSIGEVLGALLFAYVAKHLPTNRSMVLCQLCGVLGSALYVYPSKLSVLIGRICHGLWTGGSQAIQQAYLADVLPNEELTPTVVAVNAYATLGFVFGPAIGFLISIAVPKGLKVERYMWTGLGMPLDIIAPGFAVLVSACVCTALFAMVFDEETDRAHAAAVESCDAHCQSNNNNNAVYGGAGDSGSDHRGGEYVVIQSDALTKDRDACGVSVDDDESVPLLKTGNDDKIEAEEEGRQQTSGEVRADGYSMQMLVFCNIVFFVHFYGFALQETVMTPLVQNAYDWTIQDANALFTFSGILSLIAVLVIQAFANRRVSDRLFLLISFAMAALGYGLLAVTRSSTMFLIGFSLLSVAFPVGRASCVALYTKKLPKHMQHVGQGVLLAVGGIARIVGPFPAALAVDPNRNPMATTGVFASAMMAMAGCAVWLMHI